MDILRYNDVKWSFFGPFRPDIAFLSSFDPIASMFGTDIISYPIGNSPQSGTIRFPGESPMEQGMISVPNIVVMGSKELRCVISGQNGPKFPMGQGMILVANVVAMGSKELKCVISGQNGSKMTILHHYDVIYPEKSHFENFKMVPLCSLVNCLWDRVRYQCQALW